MNKRLFFLSVLFLGIFLFNSDKAQASEVPIGHVDEITSTGVLKGWAADPDALGYHTTIHAYFDGRAGIGKYLTGGSTTKARCDVNLMNNDCGFGYGFEIQLPAEVLDGKSHTVYVYALNL